MSADLLVTLTLDRFRAELRALIAELVPAEPPREWMTVTELCEYLRCSRSSANKLRAGGLPCSMIGDSPRFNRRQVDAHMMALGSAAEAAE